jgi:hypothetical protein
LPEKTPLSRNADHSPGWHNLNIQASMAATLRAFAFRLKPHRVSQP